MANFTTNSAELHFEEFVSTATFAASATATQTTEQPSLAACCSMAISSTSNLITSVSNPSTAKRKYSELQRSGAQKKHHSGVVNSELRKEGHALSKCARRDTLFSKAT